MSAKEHLEVVDLDSLVEPIARIKLHGKMLDVMPITGAAYDLASKVNDSTKSMNVKEQLAYTHKIIKELVPAIESDALFRLSPKQISSIINIATRSVQKVERRINGEERKNGKRSARRAKGGR
jgi:hypothetical protein